MSKFCFEIEMLSGKKLFLTSGQKIVHINDVKYYPYSGLSIEKAEFNDSGQNEVWLHGIFEADGIGRSDIVIASKIKILAFINKNFDQILSYYCTEMIKRDLDFHLKCEPEVIKYSKSLLKLFSKTCRADFGDENCGVDKMSFSKKYAVQEIEFTTLKCDGLELESDYFTNGTAIIELIDSSSYSFRILSHKNSYIEISGKLKIGVEQIRHVLLTPLCDKKFITCCKKFDNAVNFRGEPTIPKPNNFKNIT